jgi:hypothetical protein
MGKYGFDVGKPGMTTELQLQEEYKEAGRREGRSVKEDEKLAVVARDVSKIYPFFNSYMLSFLLDRLTEKVAAEVRLGADNQEQIAANIGKWARFNLAHTQQVRTFKGEPGSDPWGAYRGGEPVWKKVIPGEMLAKSMYTGRITGKCEALPSLVAAIFVLNGARLDDVVVLRLQGHNIGLVRFGGTLYLLNNQIVVPIDEHWKTWIENQTYMGLFSYSIAVYRDFGNGEKYFRVNDAFFNAGEGSLLERFLKLAGSPGGRAKNRGAGPQAIGSRSEALALVFGDSPTASAAPDNYTLARYAYQSLYVRNPEVYLKASVGAPRTAELAKELKSKEAIFAWIRAHVSYGSIFEDSGERIMTADEVIVFRQGGLKDQAVLAFSLLRLKGYKPGISITDRDAFVQVGNEIYDARTWDKAASLAGTVILKLTL